MREPGPLRRQSTREEPARPIAQCSLLLFMSPFVATNALSRAADSHDRDAYRGSFRHAFSTALGS